VKIIVAIARKIHESVFLYNMAEREGKSHLAKEK
jgi:hypothetical protein